MLFLCPLRYWVIPDWINKSHYVCLLLYILPFTSTMHASTYTYYIEGNKHKSPFVAYYSSSVNVLLYMYWISRLYCMTSSLIVNREPGNTPSYVYWYGCYCIHLRLFKCMQLWPFYSILAQNVQQLHWGRYHSLVLPWSKWLSLLSASKVIYITCEYSILNIIFSHVTIFPVKKAYSHHDPALPNIHCEFNMLHL